MVRSGNNLPPLILAAFSSDLGVLACRRGPAVGESETVVLLRSESMLCTSHTCAWRDQRLKSDWFDEVLEAPSNQPLLSLCAHRAQAGEVHNIDSQIPQNDSPTAGPRLALLWRRSHMSLSSDRRWTFLGKFWGLGPF